MKNILKLNLIFIFLILCHYGCNNNTESHFGLELEADADNPYVFIKSPQNNSYIENSEFITIDYNAQDVSGINIIELFANDKLVRKLSKNEINGTLYWNWKNDSISSKIELKLRAVDGVGKESWSNKVSINLDYTAFDMIDMSGYNIPCDVYARPIMHVAHDNSIWFLLKDKKLLRYNNGEFTITNIDIPVDLTPGYYPIIEDFYVSRSGNIYLRCSTSYVEANYLLYRENDKWASCQGQVYSFIENNDGSFFCTSGVRTILKIDATTGLDTFYTGNYYESLSNLAFDADNNLYCFEYDNAIYKLTGANFEPFYNISSNGWGIQYTFDKYNNIFVRGYKNGISGFYINDKKIDLLDGQIDYNSKFAVVNKDEIWFSNNNSLIRYKNNSIKIFTEMNSNITDFSYNNIYADNNGNINIYYSKIKKLIIIKNQN